jgi:iron complex outermembrane receptor protein
VTLDIKHVGDSATDRENTFTLPAYTLVNAAASWRGGPLRITVSANNLFDEEYYWSGGSETVDPGSPRQVLLTTSFLFK